MVCPVSFTRAVSSHTSSKARLALSLIYTAMLCLIQTLSYVLLPVSSPSSLGESQTPPPFYSVFYLL
jgi:hypothetical protein